MFIANRGDVNDEGRVNRVYSRSVFHMGTGGPRRFTHAAPFGRDSADPSRVRTEGVHPADDGHRRIGNGLRSARRHADQGRGAALLALRADERLRDLGHDPVVRVPAAARSTGRSPPRRCSTRSPSCNPNNPSELVYAWDPRMAASTVYNNDWSGIRGCDRESYAQPGYWHNASAAPTTYYTDPMGNRWRSRISMPWRSKSPPRRASAPRRPTTACSSSRCAQLLRAAESARPEELGRDAGRGPDGRSAWCVTSLVVASSARDFTYPGRTCPGSFLSTVPPRHRS